MTGKSYGGNNVSYSVTERPDDWIELRIHHQNRAMWNLLQLQMANPQYFLGRRDAYSRSHSRAERWLAEVMNDYHPYFRQNKVKFVLVRAVSPPEVIKPMKMTIPGRKITLVACVSEKHDQPIAAQDLYVSDWFRKASAYAQRESDEWYILSAKYGLVHPKEIIEPYDETLNAMPAEERRAWATRVLAKLIDEVLLKHDQVIILAGAQYREHLVEPLERSGLSVKVPMDFLEDSPAFNAETMWNNSELPKRE